MTIGSAGPGNGGTMRLSVGSLRVTERKETRRVSALDPSRRFRAVGRMSIGGSVVVVVRVVVVVVVDVDVEGGTLVVVVVVTPGLLAGSAGSVCASSSVRSK